MAILLYGASDDLIETEGDVSEEFSAYDFDGYVLLSNGLVFSMNFNRSGIWSIELVRGDDSLVTITRSTGEYGDDEYGYPSHSDKAEVHDSITWVRLSKTLPAA